MSDRDAHTPVTALDIALVADPATPVEKIAEVRMAVRAKLDLWKQLAAAVDAAMVEHIEATGRDLVIGDTRYYVGFPKDTDCTDKSTAAGLLLQAVGGDLDRFADCLVSQPFKPGYCRTVLAPADFGAVFVTTARQKLMDGKAKKQLLATPTELVRR